MNKEEKIIKKFTIEDLSQIITECNDMGVNFYCGLQPIVRQDRERIDNEQ